MVVPPTAFIVFPDFVKPSPAIICPAPENCDTVNSVLHKVALFNVGVPSCVNTYPLSALDPLQQNVNVPPVISDATFASDLIVSTNAFDPSPTVVTT